MADIYEYDQIFIDLKEEFNIGYDLECHQNDNLILNFVIRNYGEIIDITKYSVELRVKKPDGTEYIQGENGLLKGTKGTLKITCEDELTDVSGNCKGSLRMWNKLNNQQTTRIIKIKIKQDILEVDRSLHQSTITIMRDLNNVLNDSYEVQADFKVKISEANRVSKELNDKTSLAISTNTTLADNISKANNLNDKLVSNTTKADTSNSTLVTTNNNATTNVSTLTTKNTEATTNIANLTTQNNNATTNVSTLTTKNTEATTNIANLTTQNNNAVTNKNNLDLSNTNAINTKNVLDLSKTNADVSKTNLDNSNILAGKNIEELNKLGDVTNLAEKVQDNTTNIADNTKKIEENTVQLSQIKQHFYYSLKEINSAFTDTTDLATIIKGMKDNSTLQCRVADTEGVYPLKLYSTLIVNKSIDNVIMYFSCPNIKSLYYQTYRESTGLSDWIDISNLDSGWIQLPLTNGGAYTEGLAPRYRLIGKEVRVGGMCKGYSSINVIISTLPVGYRPTASFNTLARCGQNKYAEINVANTGEIKIVNYSGILDVNVGIDLSSISFFIG